MMGNRIAQFSALIAALALAVSPASASAAPSADKSILFEFRCDGFLAIAPVDAEPVRTIGQIPPEFKLAGEDTGKAFLGIGAWVCEYVVDGEPIGGVDYSHVSVTTESHPGSYDIWQFTDHPRLHAVATRIGVFEPLLSDLSVSLDYVADVPVAGRASVPWSESPYEVAATIPPNIVPVFRALDGCDEPLPAPTTDPEGCFPSDHWFKGSQGTVYAAHANCNVSAGAAQITVTAQPESPLALMMGSSRLVVPGLWLRTENAAARMDFAFRFEEGETERPECVPKSSVHAI